MILLWLAAGIIELFFPSFMQIIAPGARTTSVRGVTSLAMEPSFYGYTCLFFMILAARFKTGRVTYCALCVFQIVFLAQSAVGVLYLFVLGGSYIFFTASVRKKIAFIIIFIASLAVILSVIDKLEILGRSRMVNLFMTTFNNANSNVAESIEQISERDGSIASRIHAITFGIGGFLKDIGLPHGFIYRGRIMSGYGAILYEFGTIGLCVIIMITRRFLKAFSVQAAIAVSIVMLSAVQLTSPTFIFLVAVAEYESYTARRKLFA